MTDPWPLRSSLELGAELVSNAVNATGVLIEVRDSDPQPPKPRGRTTTARARVPTACSWWRPSAPAGTGTSPRNPRARSSGASWRPFRVEPDDLDRANGRMAAGQIVGFELAGPAAGGWLFGVAAVLPFAVNAGTLGIAAGRLRAADRRRRRRRLSGQRDLGRADPVHRPVADPAGGRVTSVYGTVTQGAEALGAILGGGIAVAAGIRAPMLIGAGPIVIVAVGVAWRHRRREADDAAPSAAG